MSDDQFIHVAMIIQGYHPRIGGAERQVGALAPYLMRRNIGVSVLTRRYPGLAPFALIDGVPVHRLPIPGPVPVAALSFTAAALPLLWRLQPDVLHAHELFSPSTTALAGRRAFGTPIVATPHRSGPLGDVQRMAGRPAGSGRLQAIAREAAAFTCISAEIDAELAGLGIAPERRFPIPNGVDVARFRPDPAAKAALRAKLGLPGGLVTVFAGRLAPEKRVGLLLSSWSTIHSLQPEATLVILGAGPEEPTLRAMAPPGVVFAGPVERVEDYLQAADCWALPSVAEGFSVAMLEAMACGLGVVISDVGGARDAITDGVHGLIVPPDDEAALSAALLRLHQDPSLRATLGAAARERVLEAFSLDIVADQLAALYRSVARSL